MKIVYFVLCIAGTVLPYAQFVPWVMVHGLDVPLLVRELFSTRIGGFFGMDVMVSSLVLIVFVRAEKKRRKIRHAWSVILALLTVGVSLALPLFLLLREFEEEKKA